MYIFVYRPQLSWHWKKKCGLLGSAEMQTDHFCFSAAQACFCLVTSRDCGGQPQHKCKLAELKKKKKITFNHTHNNSNTSVITVYRQDHYHMKHLNHQRWLNQNDQMILIFLLPGPLAPPRKMRPRRKIIALSYSFTICRNKKYFYLIKRAKLQQFKTAETKTASQLHHLDVEWQLLLCFHHLHFKDKNKDDKDKASH